MKRRIDLVFQFPKNIEKEFLELPQPLRWSFITPDNIIEYFKDEHLKNTFLNFLEKGFYGIFIYENSNWITYGWMSNPFTLGPIHLSGRIQCLDAFWIFYCHTKEHFRGQGSYKMLLKLLIQQAFKAGRDTEIYIDTQPNNLPAIKAILSVGFEQKGVITNYKFGIPKVKIWNWSQWNKEVVHP